MFKNSFMDFMGFHQFTEFITCSFPDLSSHHHKGEKHTLWFVKGSHPGKPMSEGWECV